MSKSIINRIIIPTQHKTPLSLLAALVDEVELEVVFVEELGLKVVFVEEELPSLRFIEGEFTVPLFSIS